MNPAELRRKAAELRESIRKLVADAETENRELNEDEQAVMAEYRAQAEALVRRAELVERVEADVAQSRQSAGRTSEPLDGRVDPGESEDDKKLRTGGFRSAGHFASTLFRGMHPSAPDERSRTQLADWRALNARAATGLNEAVDPEGGLLVPGDYATTIWDKTRDYENLADRINLVPVAGNTMTINANAERSRANGSRNGGVQGYWAGEAAQYTSSKPTFRQIELKAKKLTVLVYATNEMLDDSGGAMAAYLDRVVPAEIAFKINDALVNGGGAGIPLGVLSAPALITTTAVSGQGATTLVAQNFTDMWARIYAPCRRNGVWLINQDAETQLDGLKFATGSSSGQLVYMPPTGISGAPYASIKGRPVVVIEQCATLGTVGDVIFVDFSQYAGIKKAAGIQQAMSIHLRFDYDETVFKYSFRMDAQPLWDTTLTPFKGSATQSPFVALSSTRT